MFYAQFYYFHPPSLAAAPFTNATRPAGHDSKRQRREVRPERARNSVDAFSPEPCVQEPPQRYMPVRKPASLKLVTAVWKPVGVIACCRDVRISVSHLIPVGVQGFDIAKHHSQSQPLITHSILDESPPPFPAIQARNPRIQEVRFSDAILIFFE